MFADKKNILVAIPIALAALSVVAVGMGVNLHKKARQAQFSAQVTAASSKTDKKEFGDADLIVARQIMDGLAKANNLPVKAKTGEGTLSLSGDSALLTDGTSDIKAATLARFAGVTGLLRTMASLPYQAEYKSLCIGLDCQTGFDLVISITGKR